MIDLLIRNFYHTMKFLGQLNLDKVNIFDHKLSEIINFFHEMLTEFYIFSEIIEERTDSSDLEEVMMKMAQIYLHIGSLKTVLVEKAQTVNPTYVFNEENNLAEKVKYSKDAQTMTDNINNDATSIFDVSSSFIESLNVTVGDLNVLNRNMHNTSNNNESNNYYLDGEEFDNFEITAAVDKNLLKKDLEAQKQFMFIRSIWKDDETPLNENTKEAEDKEKEKTNNAKPVKRKAAIEEPHPKIITDVIHEKNLPGIKKDNKKVNKITKISDIKISNNKKSDVKNIELDKPKNTTKTELPQDGNAKNKKRKKNKKAKKDVTEVEHNVKQENADEDCDMKDVELETCNAKDKTESDIIVDETIIPPTDSNKPKNNSEQPEQNNNKCIPLSDEKTNIEHDLEKCVDNPPHTELNNPENNKKNNLKATTLTAMVDCYPYGKIEVIDEYVLTASSLTSNGITNVAYTIKAWNTIVTTVKNKAVYYCCCCGLTIMGENNLEEHLEDMNHYKELRSCTKYKDKEAANFCRTVKSELIHCSICDVVFHESYFHELHSHHMQELEKAMQLARNLKSRSA